MDIICVVLGADTKKFRTQDSIKLIEYVFNTYTYINIENKINEYFNNWISNNKNSFFIEKGISQNIELIYSSLENSIIPVKKEDVNNIEFLIDINTYLQAPIHENDKIGTINVLLNNSVICHCNILCKNSITKKGVSSYLLDFFKNYNNYLSSIGI